jgi:hypothetical protein
MAEVGAARSVPATKPLATKIFRQDSAQFNREGPNISVKSLGCA